MNSMARIMKANQMSNVCASFTNTHMLKKIKNLSEQNFKGTVAQPTVTGKELTSGQKEKPHAKKKNLTAKRKRLAAKRITSRQKNKNVLSASKKFCRQSFSFSRVFFVFFCREVNSFAVTVVGHRTKVKKTTSNWIVRKVTKIGFQ